VRAGRVTQGEMQWAKGGEAREKAARAAGRDFVYTQYAGETGGPFETGRLQTHKTTGRLMVNLIGRAVEYAGGSAYTACLVFTPDELQSARMQLPFAMSCSAFRQDIGEPLAAALLGTQVAAGGMNVAKIGGAVQHTYLLLWSFRTDVRAQRGDGATKADVGQLDASEALETHRGLLSAQNHYRLQTNLESVAGGGSLTLQTWLSALSSIAGTNGGPSTAEHISDSARTLLHHADDNGYVLTAAQRHACTHPGCGIDRGTIEDCSSSPSLELSEPATRALAQQLVDGIAYSGLGIVFKQDIFDQSGDVIRRAETKCSVAELEELKKSAGGPLLLHTHYEESGGAVGGACVLACVQ
jgi:hypothetical protein